MEKTVATVLLVEKQGQQRPIYYISYVFDEEEQMYELLEKMACDVLIAERKLRPYFNSHTIQVLSNQPLEKALHKLDPTDRLLKWAIVLSEFDIEYRPHTTIKAQALADFIVKMTYANAFEPGGTWQIAADGSAAQTRVWTGVEMTSPEGDIFEYVVRFSFKASNNEAEYEATLAGINLSIAADAKKILMMPDSQLVSSYIEGTYEAREPVMQKYPSKVKNVMAGLQSFEVKLIPRTDNMAANALSKLARSSTSDMKRSVMVETLTERSVDTSLSVVHTVMHGREWYDNILAYKLIDALPEDKMAA